jgi:hypothetical protein
LIPANVEAVKCDATVALRTLIEQHALVFNAKCSKCQPPRLPKIGHCVLCQASRAILLAEALSSTVIHLQEKHPSQHSGLIKAGIEGSFERTQGSRDDSFIRSASSFDERVEQPTWRQAIDITVPYLQTIPEYQIAESLDLQALTVSQAHEPTGEQLVIKWFVANRPERLRESAH